MELFADVTQYYPREQPTLSLSTTFLGRKEERLLMRNVLAALPNSDEDSMMGRQWICEAAMELVSQVAILWEKCMDSAVEKKPLAALPTLKRVWIYFHHVYSKRKRRHMVEWARAAKLNGFLLPGKPGVLCLEGDSLDVDLYVQRVRGLSWQKMSVRQTIEFSVAGVSKENDEDDAEENNESVMFDSFVDRPMTMAQFKAYLEEIGADGMFEELFFE